MPPKFHDPRESEELQITDGPIIGSAKLYNKFILENTSIID